MFVEFTGLDGEPLLANMLQISVVKLGAAWFDPETGKYTSHFFSDGNGKKVRIAKIFLGSECHEVIDSIDIIKQKLGSIAKNLYKSKEKNEHT